MNGRTCTSSIHGCDATGMCTRTTIIILVHMVGSFVNPLVHVRYLAVWRCLFQNFNAVTRSALKLLNKANQDANHLTQISCLPMPNASSCWRVWFFTGWGTREVENVFCTHGSESGFECMGDFRSGEIDIQGSLCVCHPPLPDTLPPTNPWSISRAS